MLLHRLCLFVLFVSVSLVSRAQIVETKNKFVAADVDASTGILTIRNVVDGKAKDYLSNPGHSFLTIGIDGRWYTNNNVGGSNLVGPLGGSGTPVTSVMLDGGRTSLIQDTIQTIFDEAGGAYSIIQEVYPVAFRASGQIVLRVKILNRSFVPHTVDGVQWVNDLQAGANDNPYLIERNYYDSQRWRVASVDGSNANPPSFYVEIEHDPATLSIGMMGAGFTNDSFPPSPMGLMPCSGFAVGSWQGGTPGNQILDHIFGCPAPPTPGNTTDLACVLQWKPIPIPAAAAGHEPLVEECRTSFGTQEFCMCLGNAIAINVFPTHVSFDQKSRRGAPNPLPALSMIFNIATHDITNATITHSVVAPLQIAAGGSIAKGGSSSTYSGVTLKAGEMQTFLWSDSATRYTIDTAGMAFNMIGTGYSGMWDCMGRCDVVIDAANIVSAFPSSHILSRTGSYDGSVCNARVTQVRIYDTGAQRSRIFARVDTSVNMSVGIPKVLADTLTYTVQVVDSMYDGYAIVAVSDTMGGVIRDTVRYCTIPDVHKPIILVPKDWPSTTDSIVITDKQPWDHGVRLLVSTDAKLDQIDTFIVPKLSPVVSLVNYEAPPYPSKQICIMAVDGAGNIADTCFFIGGSQSVDEANLDSVSIVPNPTSALIRIDLRNGDIELATLQNLLGRTVLTQTIRGTGEIDISKLAAGTYILRVGGVTRKIIKN